MEGWLFWRDGSFGGIALSEGWLFRMDDSFGVIALSEGLLFWRDGSFGGIFGERILQSELRGGAEISIESLEF